jgi:hypothetical protein
MNHTSDCINHMLVFVNHTGDCIYHTGVFINHTADCINHAGLLCSRKSPVSIVTCYRFDGHATGVVFSVGTVTFLFSLPIRWLSAFIFLCMKLTTHLRLLSVLTTRGVIPPITHTACGVLNHLKPSGNFTYHWV